MANGEELDQADEGQDYRPPPQTFPVAAPVVAPPGRAPIQNPYAPTFNPEEVDRNVAMRKMLMNMGDLPIAEAEKAVTTAYKFQALRGYQNDIAKGASPSDALAKWAPIMFAQPKAGSLGGAASLVRATRPTPEKYMDIGGVGYQMKEGKATPLTPLKAVKKKTYPMVVPLDPSNPETGGHITIQLDEDDPLVKKAMERMHPAPPKPALPAAPTIWSRAYDKVFGGGTPTAQPAAAPRAPNPAAAPAAPLAVAPSPIRAAKPTTPEEKLAAARALRQSHPDWSKKQILDAVNQ